MDPKRRLFLRGAVTPSAQRTVMAPRPPWAQEDDSQFTDRCSRCGDCVRACPRQLLVTGDGGFPHISFARQGCDACGHCREACTTGALVPVHLAPQRPAFRWRIEVSSQCLALHKVECRVCAESCDTGALRCRPAPGGISQLQIDTAACTGCGECIAPCPVQALSLTLPTTTRP